MDPGIIEVGGDASMIAIKYDQTNFITAPWVNITFEYRHYTKLSNGTLIKVKVRFLTIFNFPFYPNNLWLIKSFLDTCIARTLYSFSF